MDRIARIIVKHSRRILVATGLVTLVALSMLFRMDFNGDVASFVLEGNDTGETFQALQDKYQAADPINVVVSLDEGETFQSKDGLSALVRLRDEIADVDGVAAVASIIPDENPITGGPFDASMVQLAPQETIDQLFQQSPVVSLLLSEDGRHTLMMVVPEGDSLSVARRVDDVAVPDGLELTFSGNPVVFATVIDVLSVFLLLIPPVVMLLLIATFFATIGDRRLSIIALIPAALGAIWTFGLIFGLGIEIDIVTVIVPIFVIVMGSADGLHFVTHFQEEAGNDDRVDQVRSALAHVGIPMILTTISTAAGFLSLVATDVQPIRQLGLFTAIGITFAGIISFFSLPALLSRMEIEARHHQALIGPRVTRGLKALVRTRRPAVVITLGLLAFSAVTLPRLDVNPDQLFFFKDNDPVRVAFEKTEELFGGATPLMGEFVFDPAEGAGQLERLAAISADLEELSGVREVFSVADFVGSMPAGQLDAVLAGDVDLPVGIMVSSDGLRFMLLPSGFGTDDLQSWLAFADETPEIRHLTGMPVVWDEIARLVLRAQVISLAVAFLLVAVMLAVAYRRIRETVVSLIPVALTIMVMLGFIAISGIQLNLLTAVVSGIVIGVGIDYAIHFIAAIDYARRDGDGYVLRAIDRAGRPIVANALGIAIALSALWLSPLKIHPQISMIMWVAMSTAAITALVVIPALLPREGVARVPQAVPISPPSGGKAPPASAGSRGAPSA
ncbi:MAG: MMPL family transporter [Actinomycetota bacterium]|nr:MMPL family transporter [Actinomycetota bacterium]